MFFCKKDKISADVYLVIKKINLAILTIIIINSAKVLTYLETIFPNYTILLLKILTNIFLKQNFALPRLSYTDVEKFFCEKKEKSSLF